MAGILERLRAIRNKAKGIKDRAEEVGEVLEVKDGIARIYGLTKAMASEMLEITARSFLWQWNSSASSRRDW